MHRPTYDDPNAWNSAFVQGGGSVPDNVQWGPGIDQQALIEDSWTNAVQDLKTSAAGAGYAERYGVVSHPPITHPQVTPYPLQVPPHAQVPPQAVVPGLAPCAGMPGHLVVTPQGCFVQVGPGAPVPCACGPAAPPSFVPHPGIVTGAEAAPPVPMTPRTLSSYHRADWLR